MPQRPSTRAHRLAPGRRAGGLAFGEDFHVDGGPDHHQQAGQQRALQHRPVGQAFGIALRNSAIGRWTTPSKQRHIFSPSRSLRLLRARDPHREVAQPMVAALEDRRADRAFDDDIGSREHSATFAMQVLHCQDRLGIPDDRRNVIGGAISIGHPQGMSGARMDGHALTESCRRSREACEW